MVHKVIVQVGRQTEFQSQEKAIVTCDDLKVSGKVLSSHIYFGFFNQNSG